MPIYKGITPKGKVYYRVVVYSAKQKKNLTKCFDTRPKANAYQAQLIIELQKNDTFDPNAHKSVKFVDVVDKVVFKDRELSVRGQVREYFKKWKFIDIDRDAVQQWVNDEIARGIKPSTAKRYFNTLRKIFREANLDQKLPVPPDIFKRIKFKEENGEVFDENSLLDDSRDRVITDLEAEYVEKSIDKKNLNSKLYKALIIFLKETGCRCGEALKLEKKYINLKDGDIWLPPQITKTKNGRHIPITTTNQENLKQLLAMKSDSDLLFQGEWTNSNAISHRWRKHMVSAKELYWKDCAKNGVNPDEKFLVNLKVHDLRHSFITKLFTHTEMSVIEIAQISGHQDLSMLMRYSNIRPNTSRHKVW